MTPARRQLLFCTAALACVTALTAFFALSAPAPANGTSAGQPVVPTDSPRLTANHQATLAFFKKPSLSAKTDRSLFATDYFKPPAPKPAPPKIAAPPPVTPVSLVYRGFASFAGGDRIAYVAVDGKMLTLTSGAEVKDTWTLATFDSDEAQVVQGPRRVTLRFNQPVNLPVTAPPRATDKP